MWLNITTTQTEFSQVDPHAICPELFKADHIECLCGQFDAGFQEHGYRGAFLNFLVFLP